MIIRIVVFLLFTAIFGLAWDTSTANAQLFGNGRFLRRLRGESDPPKKPSESKKKSKSESKSDSKTGKKAKDPTPANRNLNSNEIGSGIRSLYSPDQSRKRMSQKPSISSGEIEKGMGIQVEELAESLIVTSISKNGNADKAGIRKGDTIRSVGGVDIKSVKDFDEIVGILRDGDQIEMVAVRRGKSEEVLVQMGEVPQLTPNTSANAPTRPELEPADMAEIPTANSYRSAELGAMRSVMRTGQTREELLERIRNYERKIEYLERQIKDLRQQNSFQPPTRFPGLNKPG